VDQKQWKSATSAVAVHLAGIFADLFITAIFYMAMCEISYGEPGH